MISIDGALVIRSSTGRKGPIKIGSLATRIGDLVINDARLDDHDDGSYVGTFTINRIRPSFYMLGERLVMEILADLQSIDTIRKASTAPNVIELKTVSRRR